MKTKPFQFTMQKSQLQVIINKGRRYLQGRGIIAIDGSGQPEVEELFRLLSWVRDGRLEIVPDK